MTQLIRIYKESLRKETNFSYMAEYYSDRMQGKAATTALAKWMQKNNLRKNPDQTTITYEQIQDFVSVLIKERSGMGREGN